MRYIPQPPLVIVEGFLGCNSAAIWGNFEEHYHQRNPYDVHITEDRQVIFASVGPVSSLHDRACELFYALKGGTVDYGETHSRVHGHNRYGRTIPQGSYTEWSTKYPLNFLGHSMGGPTIIKLQWLLSIGFFGGDYDPDMILSVTTVSAPFRGTQLVYLLGEQTDNAPAVRTFSLGSALAKMVHIISYLTPFLPSIFDLHTDSRSLSFRETSFVSFLKQLWHSDWAEGRDATPFDVTFQAAEEREAKMEGMVCPRTFYRSYAATMTRRRESEEGSCQEPSIVRNSMTSFPLYGPASAMGSFDFTSIRPRPSFLRGISRRNTAMTPTLQKNSCRSELDYDSAWSNDGVVPLFSQWHPFSCKHTRCKHFPAQDQDVTVKADGRTLVENHSTSPVPEAGVWHVHHLDGANHFTVAPIWFGSQIQKEFWQEMGKWLRQVDVMWSERDLSR